MHLQTPHNKIVIRKYRTKYKLETFAYLAAIILINLNIIFNYYRVDCGMFVTILMKERSENKAINKDDVQFTQDAITLQRGEFGYQILSCKKYSWSIEEHLTQQFLLSEANKQT